MFWRLPVYKMIYLHLAIIYIRMVNCEYFY